jgi:hypothetical protein
MWSVLSTTEEDVQQTNHHWTVLLLAHYRVDHECLHYLTQYDHQQREGRRLR